MSESEQPPVTKTASKSIDLLRIVSVPVGDVDISVGKIFLYPLRVSDMTAFNKLSDTDPAAKLRRFLPTVASLSELSEQTKERPPLEEELVARISPQELDVIAEAYAQSSVFRRLRADSTAPGSVCRAEGEGAISYLDRLLRAEVEESTKQAAAMHSRLFGPANGYFEELRKSTSAIGAKLSEYDRFRSGGSASPFQPAIDTLSNDLVAQAVQRTRERAEELQLVRMTADMTAQAARALKDLTESASAILVDREERNREEDRTTRTQLSWAIFSVIVSAVLAAFALWISAASFRQDKANNEANDKWQDTLLKEVREENVRRAALDQENQRLKAQLEELSATVERMMESKLRMADSENPSSPRSTTTRVAVPR